MKLINASNNKTSFILFSGVSQKNSNIVCKISKIKFLTSKLIMIIKTTEVALKLMDIILERTKVHLWRIKVQN